MIFSKKDLAQLQQLKIKYSPEDFDIINNYLFISRLKVVFISKYKNKLYHVCSSSDCEFDKIESQNVFNVNFSTDNLVEAINYFNKRIQELIK